MVLCRSLLLCLAALGGASAALAGEPSPIPSPTAASSSAVLGAGPSTSGSPIMESDDECLAGDTVDDPACALNALQMRGRRLVEDAGSGSDSGRHEKEAVATSREKQQPQQQCENDTGHFCMRALASCPSSLGPTDCVRNHCRCRSGFCNNGPGSPCSQGRPGQCSRHTGGTCRHFRCDATRGPTQCVDGECVCPAGLCAEDGACALQESTLVAEVVRVDAEQPTFPGAQAKIPTALCFSGGGSRSLSSVLGALRALEDLHLMQHVAAISSVSGGTWAAGIYMFADVGLEDLLGAPTQPSELTLGVLGERPAQLGATAMADTEEIGMELMAKGTAPDRLWEHTVRQAFLKPFGLDEHAFMASSPDDVAHIKELNPQLQDNKFVTPVPGRPQVFVMNGALLAPMGYLASNNNVVSLQMSPDFSGSPFRPDGGGVTYEPGPREEGPLSEELVGGGLVETFAFGGPPPVQGQGGSESAKIRAPRLPFSLADALGISSAAFASQLEQRKFTPDRLVPKVAVWPVLSSQNAAGVAARQFAVGDGGNVENGGVLAMLQRRVSRIAWWINTDTGLSMTFDFCNAPLEGDEIKHMVTNQLYDKFGYGHLAPEFYAHNQVFKKEDFPALLCELQKLIASGKPAVVRKTMAVQPNAWWGITAYDVDMVFVYNDRCADFEAALPKETRASLQQGSQGDFAHFPHFKTMFNNGARAATSLTAAQINLLAAQAEYSVRQNEALFRDLLLHSYTAADAA